MKHPPQMLVLPTRIDTLLNVGTFGSYSIRYINIIYVIFKR